MGGYGSGLTSGKQKAEDSRAVNITTLHRSGCLKAGWSGGWSWSRAGQEVGRISLRAEQGCIILDYNVRLYGGEWEPIVQTVNITHTDCNYGGQRPYFQCLGVVNALGGQTLLLDWPDQPADHAPSPRQCSQAPSQAAPTSRQRNAHFPHKFKH